MVQRAFPIDPHLTSIAVAYKSQGLVADIALPRITVGKREFSWLIYAKDAFFNAPDNHVGRRSRPNQVELSAEEVTLATEDYGLDGGVPQDDIDNADERYDPLGAEVELLQSCNANRRELRVAGIVHNAASYSAGLKQTLAGNDQFSNPETSTPIKVVSDALDLPLMRPNIAVFNQEGWTSFRRHPEIVEAVLGTAGSKGLVSRQAVADLFELDEIVVGQGRTNVAKKGQAAQLARTWGKHISLLYRNPVIQAKGAVSFGGTFDFGGPVAGQWADRNIGLRGGVGVRAGESVLETVIAADCGYFIQNAFA